MNKPDSEKLAIYMKALGHPVRVQIVRQLIKEGSCISGNISAQLPVAASTASQHLKILKDAGLISGSVDGPRRCYCVDTAKLNEAKRLLQDL